MTQSNTRLNKDERGFASLVVALIMIMVLSLITVGFAQLARREQQNALNKQLSSQAYYAAEAGINDAFNLVKQKYGLLEQENADPASLMFSPTQCLNTQPSAWQTHDATGHGTTVSSSIDDYTATSYSCVMVDLNPKSLVYHNVGPEAYRDVLFSPTNDTGAPTDLKTLYFYWGSDGNHTGLQTSDGLKPQAGSASPADNWGSDKIGMVQVSITPMGDNFTRQNLIDGQFTAYLYPKNGSNPGTTVYSTNPDSRAPLINADCSGSGDTQCKATIDNLNVPGAKSYIIHFIPYYDSTNVQISGRDSAGNVVGLQGAQVVIDSTGKSRDVLKRLQVHVPLNVDGDKPNAIEGQSICKRLAVDPTSNPQGNSPAGYPAAGPACNPWAP